ncbi:RpiB/LacA/LacB family sugar-phosphate isomerase [Actinomycetaceae bacterium MB13-C1-2]|nr:RpiB/LacA/LacB family sugar-phosphate isomerase [Actinomycetaceae bacterium MB13-C1-2]
MKIAIGADPNAAELKSTIISHVLALGHEVQDLGSEDPLYAHVAASVAQTVASGSADRGIVICGTGIGVSIAANKIPGAFCALITDTYQARRAQLSNNANVIALGAQVTGIELAKELVTTYLSEEYAESNRSREKVKALRGLEFAAR